MSRLHESWVGTRSRSLYWLVRVSSGPKIQPEVEAGVALSVGRTAPEVQQSGDAVSCAPIRAVAPQDPPR
eukprot:8255881-Alexandrium_andersonii.AAC.1